MPESEEEVKPVSVAKPRDDVYTVMLAVSAAIFITATVLVLMELQDKANFGYKLFGQ
ncbi:MAG TPA: hypothetical protein PK280_19925 [Planctomycetota bacterium]|nr:hypothetical protein [Planctomycetota bacterium]